MKKAVALAIGITLVLGGCAGSGDKEPVATTKGVPTPGQDLFPVIASSEIVVGDNRLQIGLLDGNDAPVRSPKTRLQVEFVAPGDEQPSSETTMSFLWTIKPIQGLWVGEASFESPGEWGAVIEVQGGGYDTTARTTFEVTKEGTTPVLGEKGPVVDSPTLSDVKDLSEITTDPSPERRFYELSIADALRAGKPAVIVFATPKFCTSQVCGPTLTIVKDVAEQFPRVTFVHVEPYDLDKVPEQLEPVPAVTAWGLPSEPWVFVTDENGRVAAKYEGSVAATELVRLLRSL